MPLNDGEPAEEDGAVIKITGADGRTLAPGVVLQEAMQGGLKLISFTLDALVATAPKEMTSGQLKAVLRDIKFRHNACVIVNGKPLVEEETERA